MTSTSGASFALMLRPAGRLDVGQALRVEALLFVVFARERLHHADRRQHFLDDESNSPSFFRTAREAFLIRRVIVIDDEEEHRRHRQRDQRESPVEPEHHADHPDQCQQR